MALKRIRLELARTREFPQGNPNCGYEFIAPLREDGQFDAESWKRHREDCIVRRFWQGEDDQHGMLVHGPGGRWKFSYVPDEEDDDEPIFKFNRHVMKQGEYISITDYDGVARPFHIISVHSFAPAV
jgi:hypothetical protein